MMQGSSTIVDSICTNMKAMQVRAASVNDAKELLLWP
jgi:hypothetical protein